MQTASLCSSPPPGVTEGLLDISCIAFLFQNCFPQGLILPGVGGRRAWGLGPHRLRTWFKKGVNGLLPEHTGKGTGGQFCFL